MAECRESAQRERQDPIMRASPSVRHEPDAACIVLEAGVIERRL
jgi:hypothetical protein